MTPVIFRRWKGQGGTVFALFPTHLADYAGNFCDSYEHVGQHGSADYQGCIARSRPALPAEYAALLAELRAYGGGTVYNDLVIYKKRTRQHREALRAELRHQRRKP